VGTLRRAECCLGRHAPLHDVRGQAESVVPGLYDSCARVDCYDGRIDSRHHSTPGMEDTPFRDFGRVPPIGIRNRDDSRYRYQIGAECLSLYSVCWRLSFSTRTILSTEHRFGISKLDPVKTAVGRVSFLMHCTSVGTAEWRDAQILDEVLDGADQRMYKDNQDPILQ